MVGEKAAHYLHLDAADFGDMDGEPVVRKSEALDMRDRKSTRLNSSH